MPQRDEIRERASAAWFEFRAKRPRDLTREELRRITLPHLLAHCGLHNHLESFKNRFTDVNGLIDEYVNASAASAAWFHDTIVNRMGVKTLYASRLRDALEHILAYRKEEQRR